MSDRDVRGGHDCDHVGLDVDGVCGACHEPLNPEAARRKRIKAGEERFARQYLGTCPGCGRPRLDGHLTCGDVACRTPGDLP